MRLTAPPTRWAAKPLLTVASVLTAAALCASACTVATLPDGSVSQAPPFGVNGMVEDPAGGLWVADLFGQQVLRFDPDTGVVLERYGPDQGLCGTDDLVVMDDSSLVATCPGTGFVIRIPRGGSAQLLAAVGPGVNPIEVDPAGDAVLVGFGSGDRRDLLRVPLDGGPVEVVADGLPVLNGFDFGPDGLLYVPTGGAEGLLGTGGLGTIDVATGVFTQLDLDFSPAGVNGFEFACGVAVAPTGTVYVAQCNNAGIWEVDPTNGKAEFVAAAPGPIADNVVLLSDGRLVLSGFFGGTVTVFEQAGGGWAYLQRVIGG